jgi:hypothetical protein
MRIHLSRLILLPILGTLHFAILYGSIETKPLMAQETQRPPEAELYFGAVASDVKESIDPVLQTTNPSGLQDVPLKAILLRIEELTNRQVVFDALAFSDAGIDLTLDSVIAEWPLGESVQKLLARLPQSTPNELIWGLDERVLTLTTVEKASEWYSTKRYFVGDLISEPMSAEFISEILQQETSGPWHDDEPGTGTSTAFGNHLFVRQTLKVHSEVRGLLNAIRSDKPIVLIGRSEEDLRLRRLLEEETVSFDWPDVELVEFARRLQELTGARFHCDEQALTDCGLAPDTRIDARSRGLRLQRALEINLGSTNGEALHDTALTWAIEDGAIKFTTAEKASERYESILYNVGQMGITGDKVGQLITLLEFETTGPWDAEQPGTGTITQLPSRNSILVRQTPRVHREILTLLADLRTLPKSQPLFTTDLPQKVQTRYYSLAPETAKALMDSIPKLIAPGTWSQDSTLVGTPDNGNRDAAIPQPEHPGQLAVIPVPARTQAIHVIEKVRGGLDSTLIEEQFRGKDSAKVQVEADCYMAVTHTADVHAQILQLIKQLHRIPEPVPSGSQGGGFFDIQGHR